MQDRQKISHQGRHKGFNLLNVVLVGVALLLTGQALAARSVSAGWDFGLWFPVLMGAVLVLFVLIRLLLGHRLFMRPVWQRSVRILIGLLAAVFATVIILLVTEPARRNVETVAPGSWLVVLGCGIKPDGTPSWALANRLDAALDYVRENPETRVVVSGGQGSNEPIPEALSMARYLQARGIPATEILLEDRSTSTMENFQFSREILQAHGWDGEPILFATNDFHLFRSRLLARRNGFDAYGIGAPTPLPIRPNAYIRESVALFKSLAFDRLR